MTSVNDPLEFQATEHCLLCSSAFDTSNLPRQFIACFSPSPKSNTPAYILAVVLDESSRVLCSEWAIFPKTRSEVETSGYPGPRALKICRYDVDPTPTNPVPTANCIHEYCWYTSSTAIRSAVATSDTSVFNLWYRLLCSSTTMYTSLEDRILADDLPNELDRGMQTILLHDLTASFTPESLLLLQRLSTLPPEIRVHVWKNMSESVARSTILTLSRYNEIIQIATVPKPRNFCKVRISPTISSSTWAVIGVPYLSISAFTTGKIKDISAVEFRLGVRGLFAIRLHCEKQSFDWIGAEINKSHEVWTGVIKNYNRVEYLSIKGNPQIRRVDFGVEERDLFGDRFMWDEVPPHTAVCRKENFYDHWAGPPASIQCFPNWRLMRYLPLRLHGSYLSKLTVFCKGEGIVGLQSQFCPRDMPEMTRHIGSYEGSPVEFSMQGEEYITHLWILHAESEASPPMLMLQSSIGRRGTFPSRLNLADYKTQELVAPKHGRISGIYYDALRTLSNYFIAFGATCTNTMEMDTSL